MVTSSFRRQGGGIKLLSNVFGFAAIELLCFHIPGKTDQAHDPDSIPVHVEFVPGQAMTGRLGMGVVVIVPALTKRQQRHS